MKRYKSILVSIVILVLSSCSSASDSPDEFTIPMSDIGADVQKNKYLQVVAPEGWNSFETRESIALDMRNISGNQIAFDSDLGARIFVFAQKEWLEVGNKMIYQNDPIVLDPSPTDNWYVDKTASVILRPDLPDYSVQCFLRIFVIGNMIENGKPSKTVGTYIDIKLNP